MEGGFTGGGPGWEVAIPFTDEMDEFGVRVELSLDLLLVLPGEVPGILAAAVPWEVSVGLHSPWRSSAFPGNLPSTQPTGRWITKPNGNAILVFGK